MDGRYKHMIDSLGPDLFKKVHNSRVLMVGAGGIGCELLKNLVLAGFGNIEIIDLDTIDLSNLNRQFLFQHKHIKQSKAHVARETALQFNPHVNIKSHHNSIYEDQFNVPWFQSFDLVMGALDNLKARQYVNQKCLQAGVPLIESGTAGHFGQTSLHIKDVSRCYSCEPKAVPKSAASCTIRSTPTAPIHCIVWAKSYLFPKLFGEDEDAIQEDAESAQTAEQLETLRKESAATSRLRAAIGSEDFGKMVMQQVFHDDIEELLNQKEPLSWRKQPTALDIEKLVAEAVEAKDRGSVKWERRVWEKEEAAHVFLESICTLSKRLADGLKEDPKFTLEFDKDDEAAMDFVTATGNLRAHVYDIERKSRWETKEMAGNIIPAIATTNAIISGLVVITAIRVLDGKYAALPVEADGKTKQVKEQWTNTYLTGPGGINPDPMGPINPKCPVCRTNFLTLRANLTKFTLGQLAELLQKESEEDDEAVEQGLRLEVEGIDLGDRRLWDIDLEGPVEKSLHDLQASNGTVLTVFADCDEPGHTLTVDLVLEHVDSMEGDFYELVGNRKLSSRPVSNPSEEEERKEAKKEDEHKSLKRGADEMETDESNGPNKKAREEGAVQIDLEDEEDTAILIE